MLSASLTVTLVRRVYDMFENGPLQCNPRLVALTALVQPRCTHLLCTAHGIVNRLYTSASQLELVHLPYRLQQCRTGGVLVQLLIQTGRLNEEEGGFASTAGLETVQRRIDAQLDLFQRG